MMLQPNHNLFSKASPYVPPTLMALWIWSKQASNKLLRHSEWWILAQQLHHKTHRSWKEMGCITLEENYIKSVIYATSGRPKVPCRQKSRWIIRGKVHSSSILHIKIIASNNVTKIDVNSWWSIFFLFKKNVLFFWGPSIYWPSLIAL